MIRYTILIVVLAAVLGCNNGEETSPFDEILTAAPYAPLTDSIRKEPKRDDLYFRRAILLNTNNYPEPALADFRQAWSLQKQERYAFGISTILIEKKPDSAIAFLDGALKELPESILLKLSLARAYDLQNKTDEALRVAEDILRINPEQVDVLKMKAELLDKKGNPGDAINTLENAYQLTPYDVELNYVLALKYAENKNPKVLALCDSLAKADSLNIHAEPYYYKGIYYSNINDKARALALFNEAITRDYNFLDAHIEKGTLLYEQKKYAEAYTVFNTAMSISPKYADAYYWMAKAQQAMGQKDEARLNYQRAYGLDKTLVQAKDSADKL
jgi:tetratricopeptide (TPR) repeat protein